MRMSTSSVFASQSMIFTIAAAPPSIQQAALHAPVLENAVADTTMDVLAHVLAIALTVSHAPFLISAILVPCGIFLSCPSLLISRAIVTIAVAPYHSVAILITLLPFASRKDVLAAMIIAACNLMVVSHLAAVAIDSVAIIAVSTAADSCAEAEAAPPKHHHYLIAATAIGLCASTDSELRIFLLLSYCVLAASSIFRRLALK
jgi:hypothetical protein